MNRDKEKELVADLLRLLRRYKDYEKPYLRNDGDIVILQPEKDVFPGAIVS